MNPVGLHELNPVGLHELNPVGLHELNPVGLHELNPVGLHDLNPVGLQPVLMRPGSRRIHPAARVVKREPFRGGVLDIRQNAT